MNKPNQLSWSQHPFLPSLLHQRSLPQCCHHRPKLLASIPFLGELVKSQVHLWARVPNAALHMGLFSSLEAYRWCQPAESGLQHLRIQHQTETQRTPKGTRKSWSSPSIFWRDTN
ncbi:hypothetical protein PDJAM_G00108630 [Pangasius djambal]|uniref:Uncharacterized protein n=1 Tax=Pangasius djambal TaxID=1691987 RepID=A0ACC5Y1J9_9TELE|nr:hypothetical protein [Pangasius djambal]